MLVAVKTTNVQIHQSQRIPRDSKIFYSPASSSFVPLRADHGLFCLGLIHPTNMVTMDCYVRGRCWVQFKVLNTSGELVGMPVTNHRRTVISWETCPIASSEPTVLSQRPSLGLGLTGPRRLKSSLDT